MAETKSTILGNIADWIKTGIRFNVKAANVRTILNRIVNSTLNVEDDGVDSSDITTGTETDYKLWSVADVVQAVGDHGSGGSLETQTAASFESSKSLDFSNLAKEIGTPSSPVTDGEGWTIDLTDAQVGSIIRIWFNGSTEPLTDNYDVINDLNWSANVLLEIFIKYGEDGKYRMEGDEWTEKFDPLESEYVWRIDDLSSGYSGITDVGESYAGSPVDLGPGGADPLPEFDDTNKWLEWNIDSNGDAVANRDELDTDSALGLGTGDPRTFCWRMILKTTWDGSEDNAYIFSRSGNSRIEIPSGRNIRYKGDVSGANSNVELVSASDVPQAESPSLDDFATICIAMDDTGWTAYVDGVEVNSGSEDFTHDLTGGVLYWSLGGTAEFFGWMNGAIIIDDRKWTATEALEAHQYFVTNLQD